MSQSSGVSDILASAFLSLCILTTTYITTSCFTASFRPEILAESDRDRYANNVITSYSLGAVAFFLGDYHSLVAFSYPETPSLICPNTSNISPELFTWNVLTISYVTLVITSGYVLFQCFIQLGEHANSDLHLVAPKKLVTGGIYSWVQHPSYAATFVILCANSAVMYRTDGAVGCWLPSSFFNGSFVGLALQIVYGLILAATLGALGMRVRSEEIILKNTFGSDWEAYHKQTKRFIPWII